MVIDKSLLENGNQFLPQFEKRGGLIPTVVQEQGTNEILMLGYVNKEALDETLKTGMAAFWSTSRNELWVKGKTSGDYMKIIEIKTDCDQDAFIYVVELLGSGCCHTKDESGATRKKCFYRSFTPEELELKESK